MIESYRSVSGLALGTVQFAHLGLPDLHCDVENLINPVR